MSTKSTIFSTIRDHCYYETIEHVKDKDGNDHPPIYLSLSKETVEIDQDDQWDILLKFTEPDSHIYKTIKNIKDINLKEIAIVYLKECIEDEERLSEECIQELEDEEQSDECMERIKEYQNVLDLINRKI